MRLVARSVTASHVLTHLLALCAMAQAPGISADDGEGLSPNEGEGQGRTTPWTEGEGPERGGGGGAEGIKLQLELYPPEIDHLLVHTERTVHINCSMITTSPSQSPLSLSVSSNGGNRRAINALSPNPSFPPSFANHTSSPSNDYTDEDGFPTMEDLYNHTYIATITSRNAKVAIVSGPEHLIQRVDNRTDEIVLELNPFAETTFTVRAQHIGHTLMVIRVQSLYSYYYQNDLFNLTNSDFGLSASNLDKTGSGFLNDDDSVSAAPTLSTLEYPVTVVRRLRNVDVVFDFVVAVMACLNSFSMGCLTDWPSLRHHLKHPSALLIGLACQFLVMPSMALGLAKSLAMGREEGLGLFYVACVPAGGAGHIVVSIINGDRALSVALNFFSCVLAVASMPLWLIGLGGFLGLHWPGLLGMLVDFELWLGGSAVAYVLGALLHAARPKLTKGFLNWIVKPWLLLFTIVFSTIGMYINLYMFVHIEPVTPIAAGLLPVLGYAVGVMIAFLSRQDSEYLKTITTEATFSNCMLVLAMVRFTLPQPEADLVSSIPMWVIFLMPIPFVLTFLVQGTKRVLTDHCDRRREKKYRNFSIVSSLLNVTNVTTLSSSLTPKMNSPIDDSTMLIDEKVTVL